MVSLRVVFLLKRIFDLGSGIFRQKCPLGTFAETCRKMKRVIFLKLRIPLQEGNFLLKWREFRQKGSI